MLSDCPKRPTICRIDLSALLNNYLTIKKLADCGLIAVVKADAYGHGAVEVSRVLEKAGVDYLGVAILEEAIQLRNAGISSPILVMGGLFSGQEENAIKHKLTPVIYSLESAGRINSAAKAAGTTCPVHLKIDTGMGRLGISISQTDSFLHELLKLDSIFLEGIATHFSSADEEDGTATEKQIELFMEVVNKARKKGFSCPLVHASNSAGIAKFRNKSFSLVRPGINLYGAMPSPEMNLLPGLKPAMALETGIMEIRELDKGSPVSYGGTYVTKKKSRIAVLPIGYGDGYPRELSNKGSVIIHGRRATIVGRVCMDMTMVDVSDIENVKRGDTAYLIGGEKGLNISADEVARLAGTIAYDIFCGIGKRVPRTYEGNE